MIVVIEYKYDIDCIGDLISITEYPDISSYNHTSSVDRYLTSLEDHGGTWIIQNNILHVAFDTDKLRDGVNRICNTIKKYEEAIPLLAPHFEKYQRNIKLGKILEQ